MTKQRLKELQRLQKLIKEEVNHMILEEISKGLYNKLMHDLAYLKNKLYGNKYTTQIDYIISTLTRANKI